MDEKQGLRTCDTTAGEAREVEQRARELARRVMSTPPEPQKWRAERKSERRVSQKREKIEPERN
jgi:hypothetical protein